MPIEYPFDDFVADYAAIAQKIHDAGPDGPEETIPILFPYMRSKYGEFAQERAAAYMMICMYLSKHSEAFDQGDYYVYGSKDAGALVSTHLLKAVHHLFPQRELAGLDEVTPEDVMRLADTFRE